MPRRVPGHRRARRVAGGFLAVAIAMLASASQSMAAAPLNDNYLASTRMMNAGAVKRSFSEMIDTTAATTQPDLFNPDRDGLPFGGGAAESTSCGGLSFGKTVWYDFAPEHPGGVQIVTGGYDTVVRVYEYNATTARITREVACQNTPAAGEQVLVPKVKAATSYTIQVGGVGMASGLLSFGFKYFPDRDGDGFLDESPDPCPDLPGIREGAGCPPELRPVVSVPYRDAPGGVRLTGLTVSALPKGATVKARCGHCGPSQTRIARGPVVSMSRFVGRTLRRGDRLEVFVTRSKTGTGKFKYGAIGNYSRYTVRSDGRTSHVSRCLKPGSMTPLRRCT